MKRKIAIIGSGFSGLAAASYLANQGMQVTVFEKNGAPGGRAGIIESDGFSFDKGPASYWMPDVFDRFFEQLNRKREDYYKLEIISPSYRVYFSENDFLDIPPSLEELKSLFESIEKGAGKQLDKYMQEAAYKYEMVMKRLIYKPSLSSWEYLEPWILNAIFRINLTRSASAYIRSFFSNPRLIQILEFPLLFFGAAPQKIPALFTFMNYALMVMPGLYPPSGMSSVVQAFYKLANDLSVQFNFNSEVTKIEITENEARGLWCNKEFYEFDVILGTADYHHIETALLPAENRSYSDRYWKSRKLSPSALMYFIAVNRELNIKHHNLLLGKDPKKHAEQLYQKPAWPDDPSMYVTASSKLEKTSVTKGIENLVVLIPVASGLQDTQETRDKYFRLFLQKFLDYTGEDIKNNIVFQKSYANNDFEKEYNSFKGNAFGLSNILRQSAIFRPSVKSRKVKNLFFAGQFTIPGPGIPACIVSGQVAAMEILKRI